MKLTECLVVFSNVPKHKAKRGYLTQKMAVCFMEQLKELFLGYISVFCYVF